MKSFDMKRTINSFLSAAVLAAFLTSCVSLQDRVMTTQESASARVLGQVTAKFISHQFFHVRNDSKIKTKARNELMREARQKYAGDIEIRNIRMSGGPTNWMVLNVLGHLLSGALIVGGFALVPIVSDVDSDTEAIALALTSAWGGIISELSFLALSGNTQEITATGDVVLRSPVQGGSAGNAPAPGGNTDNAPVPGGNF